MTQINDCSKFTVKTPEYINCKGRNILFQQKQARDADCNKRIEEAKKNSLAALTQKFDCKEKLPPQTWKEWGESLTDLEGWKTYGKSWTDLKSWEEWATLPKLIEVTVKVALFAGTVKSIQNQRELNFLNNAALVRPQARLSNALKHTGVVAQQHREPSLPRD